MDRYRVELENRDIECEISGNGIGLSIVKKVLDLSGFTGDIQIEDGWFVVTIAFKR